MCIKTKQIDNQSLKGSKKSRKAIKIKPINKTLAMYLKQKTVVFSGALCPSQSLVKRVAEYIIGGKTIIRIVKNPALKIVKSYSDSNFYDARQCIEGF